MISLTTALLIGFSGSGGVVIGCLMRQPEINRLRKMVRQLNNKNSELRKLLDEQMVQIDVMEDELRAYKFFNLIKKRETKIELRKNLIAQYACKEYIDILLKKDKNRGEKLDDDQERFFGIMDNYINRKEVVTEDKKYMDHYIITKYKDNIRKCEKWDYHQLIEK